ncbi:MAG: hypothetical protein HY047_10040 [Acidobacteria bacterium]|nr:hypothetical protein [Acidobacteriota bacterium]
MIRKFISGVLAVATSAMLAGQTPSRYDRAAEQRITGTIKAVASYPAADGGVGVHLDLTTADGFVSVHLGPAMYIGQNNFWFFADDNVEIIGTRVETNGNVAVWAKAIRKGSDILVLRLADGTPKWTPADEGIDGCGVNHLPLQRGTER